MTFCSTFLFVGFASIFLRTALCNVIMICVASETVEMLSVGLSVSAYQPVFLSLSPSSLSAFKPHFLSLSPVKQQRFARNKNLLTNSSIDSHPFIHRFTCLRMHPPVHCSPDLSSFVFCHHHRCHRFQQRGSALWPAFSSVNLSPSFIFTLGFTWWSLSPLLHLRNGVQQTQKFDFPLLTSPGPSKRSHCKPGVGQNIALHAWRKSTFPILCYNIIFMYYF